MEPEEYRISVENQILAIIKQFLDSGQMSAERTKEIAQCVIQILLPCRSIQEINNAVATIAQQFTEFSLLSISTVNEYEEKTKANILPQVHELIQGGNIDAASDLLKKITQSDSPATT